MKHIVLFIGVLIHTIVSFSQDLGGFEMSAYSGVLGVNLQPANLASSPYSVDANVIAFSVKGFVKEFLPETKLGNSLYVGNELSLTAMLKSSQRNFFVNGSVLMPSASVRINAKSGLAFTWRYRVVAYGSVTNSSLSILAQNEYDTKALAEIPLVQNATGIANSWEEFGLSYGRSVYCKKRHKLDLGISAKYLVGGASGYLEIDGLKIDYDKESNALNNVGGAITLNYNSELDDLSEGESKTLFNSSGYGMGFGVNYEYKSAKYLNKRVDRQNKPNYLFKVSTSFRDIGKVFFKASDRAASYKIKQSTAVNADSFNDIQSVSDFQSRIENNFSLETNKLQDYSLRLPTTWNLNIDWNVWRNFYLNNYVDVVGVQMRENYFSSKMLVLHKISGRFEKEKYGVYTSFNYNKYSKWGSSLSVRYSVLYLGVSNLVKLSAKESAKTLGVMLALKVPILSKSETKKGRIF